DGRPPRRPRAARRRYPRAGRLRFFLSLGRRRSRALPPVSVVETVLPIPRHPHGWPRRHRHRRLGRLLGPAGRRPLLRHRVTGRRPMRWLWVTLLAGCYSTVSIRPSEVPKMNGMYVSYGPGAVVSAGNIAVGGSTPASISFTTVETDRSHIDFVTPDG